MLAVAIPIVAEYGFIPMPGFEDTRALAGGRCRRRDPAARGLQHLNKWQENWILYRATCEGLRHEQHLFFEKAGPYANLKPETAQRLLAERVGALVSAEHSKWVHARSEKTETTFE